MDQIRITSPSSIPTAPLIPSVSSVPTTSPGPLNIHSVSRFVPAIAVFTKQIHLELEGRKGQLRQLNPTRRDWLVRHLEGLAGQPPQADRDIRHWIDGPLSAVRQTALETFFEEVAILWLGQALILKSWVDRGIRKWQAADLSNLNWSLSQALKPHVPLQRDGWFITRPNLYTWYNPSEKLAREIFDTLSQWDLQAESAQFLIQLLLQARRFTPDRAEYRGFDARFFGSLWQGLREGGWITPSSPSRMLQAFSPTLRHASWFQDTDCQWIGAEADPYLLALAELFLLWEGPQAPPLWMNGSGLEVHSRGQLQLLSASPKPAIADQIAEIEACEACVIWEEQAIRADARSPESTLFRAQLDSLPFYKKLRSGRVSKGALQACIGSTKLRPGGTLIWLRGEPLTSTEGTEVLNFLLERTKLIAEADLSKIQHSLPSDQPLFPCYLYLFQREISIEARNAHRPQRVATEGKIRSHVELPYFVQDIVRSLKGPVEPHGHWEIRAHVSPSPQNEWQHRWPDPTCPKQLQRMDLLRSASAPLGKYCSVRSHKESTLEAKAAHSRDFFKTSREPDLLFIRQVVQNSQRRLSISGTPGKSGEDLVIVLPQAHWKAPLHRYLESAEVNEWLDLHAERKGGRWLLREADVRILPIPLSLLELLQGKPLNIPPEWAARLRRISAEPSEVLSTLNILDPAKENDRQVLTCIFCEAAVALQEHQKNQERLLSMVTPAGEIRWNALIAALPASEVQPLVGHTSVRLTGALPAHIPITSIQKTKTPSLLLVTEAGFSQHLIAADEGWLDLIANQLNEFKHPTWGEILETVRLPKKRETATDTARDVLRAFAVESKKHEMFLEILNVCKCF